MASAHIHNTDKAWMSWLRKCSKLVGSSGTSLYIEYSSNEAAFAKTVQLWTDTICTRWAFCHNSSAPMSSSDIACARHRYLDKYPLTHEQKCSAFYVDALLAIDKAQVCLRRGKTMSCKHCQAKDQQIAKLRSLLKTQDIVKDEEIVDKELVKSLFFRYFMLNGVTRTSRTVVRETLEKALQDEIGLEHVLPSSSPAWRAVLYDTLGASSGDNLPILCLRRQHPLPPAD